MPKMRDTVFAKDHSMHLHGQQRQPPYIILTSWVAHKSETLLKYKTLYQVFLSIVTCTTIYRQIFRMRLHISVCSSNRVLISFAGSSRNIFEEFTIKTCDLKNQTSLIISVLQNKQVLSGLVEQSLIGTLLCVKVSVLRKPACCHN